MKSLMQIAQECDLRYNCLYEIVYDNGIIPAKRVGGRIFFDKYQEDYIHWVLYFSLKCTELTLESKMNFPEPELQKETFDEFKLRTYKKAS